MARPPGLLLRRELRRTAKRWQFAAFRAVPVVVLTVVFAVTLSFAIVDVRNAAGEVGRDLFQTISALLLVFVSIVVPLQTIAGVQEERRSGTLDLLALTGVSPGQALWTSVGARTLVVVVVLLGCAPILSLLPTLGGVSLTEAVGAAIAVVSIGVTLGAIAGLVGVISKSAALPVMATIGWLVLVALFVPILLVDVLQRGTNEFDPSLSDAFYPVSLMDGGNPFSLISLVPWAITACVAAAMATWRFRQGVATGWDTHTRSWVGPGWLFWAHVAFQVGGWALLQSAGFGGDRYNGTGLLDGWVLWPAIGLGLALVVSASLLYLRTMSWLLPRMGTSQTWFRVPVLGDPVIWRELATNAAGGVTRGTWIALGLWVLITGGMIAVYGIDDDVVMPAGLLAGFGALLFSLLIATSSMLEDRQRRTLPLLVASTYPAWRVVAGKLFASMVRVVPFVVLGLGVMALEVPEIFMGPTHTIDPLYARESAMGPMVGASIPGIRLFGTLLWLVGLWLAAVSQALMLALWIRARALAWLLPVIVGAGSPFFLVFLAESVKPSRYGSPSVSSEVLAALLFPFNGAYGSRSTGGVPLELLISGVGWWVIGLALAAACVWVVRKYGTVRT